MRKDGINLSIETKKIVSREDREKLNGHRGITVWLTGLSGAGKTTIANYCAERFHSMGMLTAVLDGDVIRGGLNSGLGFSPEDRKENVRRFGEVAKILTQLGIINFVAVISPYREDRVNARNIQEKGDFIEVFVTAHPDVLEARDTKGLYKKARSGEISNLTGINAPYETPYNADLMIDTDFWSLEESFFAIKELVMCHQLMPSAIEEFEKIASGKIDYEIVDSKLLVTYRIIPKVIRCKRLEVVEYYKNKTIEIKILFNLTHGKWGECVYSSDVHPNCREHMVVCVDPIIKHRLDNFYANPTAETLLENVIHLGSVLSVLDFSDPLRSTWELLRQKGVY